MRVETAVRRHIVFALVVAALLVGRPQDAWAKQDWWGWLEEFSGPGPFDGREYSVEFLCINLAQRLQVPVKDYQPLFSQFPTALRQVDTRVKSLSALLTSQYPTVAAFQVQEAGRPPEAQSPSPDLLRKLFVDMEALDGLLKRAPSAGDVYASTLGIQETLKKVDAKSTAADPLVSSALDFVQLSAAAASLVGRGIDGKAKSNSKTTRAFTKPRGKFWLRSCREAQSLVDVERKQEQHRIAAYTSTGNPPPPVDDIGSPADKERFVIERRDWQTGLVLGVGRYRSMENALFDPNGSVGDEPQVRLVPLEFVAHSKLSSSIDIGAGAGIAFLKTTLTNERDRPYFARATGADYTNSVLYVVPLSIVVRPGRMFTNARWASVAGYRLSLRYFSDLSANDFGRNATSAPEQGTGTKGSRYSPAGEFVWGAAFFVDGVAAGEVVGDIVEKIRGRNKSAPKP